MFSTSDCIFISVKEVLSKALSPIYSTFCKGPMPVNEQHSENAPPPIDSTFCKELMPVNEQHSENAPPPIDNILDGREIVCKA